MEFCELSKVAEALLKSICKARKMGKDPARVVWDLFQKTRKQSEYGGDFSSTIREGISELENAGYITTQWAGDSLTSILVNVSTETYHKKLKESNQDRGIVSRIVGFFKH